MAKATPDELKELAAYMAATVLNGETIPSEYAGLSSSVDSNAKTVTTTFVHSFTADIDNANPNNIVLTVV